MLLISHVLAIYFPSYTVRSYLSSVISSGAHPTVPAKVQELAESLQQISGQLNTVLSALGSLAQRQNVAPYTAFPLPLSQPHSAPAPTSSTFTSAPILPQVHTLGPTSLPTLPAVRLSEPPWNWAPQSSSAAAPLFSTPINSGPRASEDVMSSRWSQIFPGTQTAEPFRLTLSVAKNNLRYCCWS